MDGVMSSDESSGSHSHEVPSTVESDSLISLNFQDSDGASTRFSITGDRGPARQNYILISAVKRGRRSEVRSLLSENYDHENIDEEDSDGKTALHWAAEKGLSQIAELLLQKNASISLQDNTGRTPLFYAVETAELDVVKLLLEKCKVNDSLIMDRDGKTALYHAAEKDMLDIVKEFVDKRFYSHTLHLAAKYGMDNIVATLARFRTDEPDTTGQTALHIAAQNGDLETVRKLKQYRFSHMITSHKGLTALHFAAENGHIDVVRFLIEWGADLDAETRRRWTPLHIASEGGYQEVVEFLIDNGARLNAQTRSGWTAAHLACWKRQEQVAIYLFRKGRECTNQIFTVENYDHATGFHWAARYGCTELVKEFVGDMNSGNGDLEVLRKSFEGRSVTYSAIENNHQETAQALLLLNDEVSLQGVDEEGNKALHLAAHYGLFELVQYLLNNNKVNRTMIKKTNKNGETPIHCAARNGHGRVVRALLQELASQNGQGAGIATEGWSPLHWAVHYGDPTIVGHLVVAGANISEAAADGRTPKELAERLTTADKSEIFVEMSEWLTPDIIHTEPQVPNLTLPQPASNEMKQVCEATKAYILDSYESRGRTYSLEKTQLSVFDVLYKHGPELIMSNAWRRQTSIRENQVQIGAGVRGAANTPEERGLMFRWIHLPANNWVWVEDLIQTIYEKKPYNSARKANDHFQLRNFVAESCIKHPGLANERFMEPVFKHTRATAGPGIEPSSSGASSGSEMKVLKSLKRCRVVLSVPYFSFSSSKNQEKLLGIIEQASIQRRQADPTNGRHNGTTDGEAAEPRNDLNVEGTGQIWDETMIKAYETDDGKGIHVSRTLDRFYYHSLPDTKKRDETQVLSGYKAKLDNRTKTNPDDPLCMVDQLWLFVVDDETIITCFPQQQGEENTTNLQKLIRNHFVRDKDTRPPITTACEMATLILSLCMKETLSLDGSFEDRVKRLPHVFGASIGEAANTEVELFSAFKNSTKPYSTKPCSSSEAVNDESPEQNETREEVRKKRTRDIYAEIKLLDKIKDILDELNIVKIVLEEQEYVSGQAFDLVNAVQKETRVEDNNRDTNEQQAGVKVVDYYKEKSELGLRIREVARMIEDAEKMYKNINHLLDLKQKDANVSEAIWARKSSEDTTRQGRTILVFTIVTIIFLPMSFLTSLFALNITSFPHNSEGPQYSPRWAFSRIIGITVAISLPLIVLAIFVNHTWDFLAALFDLDLEREEIEPAGHKAGAKTRELFKENWTSLTAGGGSGTNAERQGTPNQNSDQQPRNNTEPSGHGQRQMGLLRRFRGRVFRGDVGPAVNAGEQQA